MSLEELNLVHLTETERDDIFDVMRRDEQLQRKEDDRISKIKAEIKLLRMKGVIKAGMNPDKTCARCRKPFGLLFNRGELCPQCHSNICKTCKEPTNKEDSWLCTLCYKQMELKAMSGMWFFSKFRKSKRHKKSLKIISGRELVRHSLKQPNAHGMGSRGAPTEGKHELLQKNSKHANVHHYMTDSDNSDDPEGFTKHKRHKYETGVAYPNEDDQKKLQVLVQQSKLAPHHHKDFTRKRVQSNRFQSDTSSSDEGNKKMLSIRSMDNTVGSNSMSPISPTDNRTFCNQKSPDVVGYAEENSATESSTIVESPRPVVQNQKVELSIANESHPENEASPQQIRDNKNGEMPDSTLNYSEEETGEVIPVDLGKEAGEEYDTEQLTNIKFRRCSTIKTKDLKSDGDHYTTEDTNLTGKAEADLDLRILPTTVSSDSDQADYGSKQRNKNMKEHVKFALDTKTEADQHLSESKFPKESISEPSVPKAAPISENSEDGTNWDDNIDDIVAQHRDGITDHESRSLQRSNLHTPFSESRESLTSYYSSAGETNYGRIEVTGDIQFGIDYNYKTGVFEVKIKACKDLAPVDLKRKRSDPYVKTYLLPDKTRHGKRKTRVKKHTLNPTFDETIKYFITKSELETRTLWVTVWHNDRFGRNDFLGEVTVPLDYYKFKDSTPHWYPLKSRNPVPLSLLTYKGDLILSLKYITPDQAEEENPGKGVLHVHLKEARNLTAVRGNGSSDPFCKGYLLPEKNKTVKQKTNVVKKDCNPYWNHTFVFTDVSQHELRNRCLELTVWDYDKITSNDFLGGVRLNLGTGKTQDQPVEWMDARGEEVSMWQSMLDRPNYWIEGSMLLRANMDRRQ